MAVHRDEIERILVITLSNLGDVVLTTPVVEALIKEFPKASLEVMVGPNGAPVFEAHPGISELIVYDKFKPLSERLRLIWRLKKKRYSLIVDLRNTLMPYMIGAPHVSLPFKQFSKHLAHKKDIHLWKLKTLSIKISDAPRRLYVKDADRQYAANALKPLSGRRLVAINAGAKNHMKRWNGEGFAYVIRRLTEELGAGIVMIGSPEEATVASDILGGNENRALNLAGKTTVPQMIALLEKVDLLITNDSAPLHIGSILGKKVLAIFGPTDSGEYGPFSHGSAALWKPVFCAPCKKAHCMFDHECMRFLKEKRVFEAAKAMLEGRPLQNLEPKRVLIVRTDRIGDVTLSTPVIKAIYDAYPNSFISFMVRPYAREIVEGNPYLDEVIVFDKRGSHKGLLGTARLAHTLKDKKFDIALVLHPTIRVHLIAFLARIPARIGYDKKMGFLLSKRIGHTKQLGQKHEAEYSLDILKEIGIEGRDTKPMVPQDGEAARKIGEILVSRGVGAEDIVIGIHPGASCPSKRWPLKKFAELADRLTKTLRAKVVIVAGPSDKRIGDELVSLAKNKGRVINLAGCTSVKGLAALLKRCNLFISNDSGPVHIAVAAGTPVIAIFGRNEKGLSPARWKPLGEDDIVIHKEVGCAECLAHECKIDFRCIRSIEVDEVMGAVGKFKDRFTKK